MPFPSFEKLLERVPQQVQDWARQVAAQMQGWLSIEHYDDGTHSDIHASSVTLLPSAASGVTGEIVLTTEDGITTTLAASRRDSPFDIQEAVLRITVDKEAPSGAKPIILDLGYMSPHLSGYTSGPGLFLSEPYIYSSIGSQRQGWAITSGIGDLLLSGRSMLAITDTVEDKSMLAIRPIGAPGAVSGYVFGPLDGGIAALGTPLYLGRAATGERWTAIHAIDIVATGAVTASTLNVTSFTVATLIVTTNVVSPVYIVGTADTNGIRLDVASGFMRVLEGDGSAFGPMQVGTIISTGGYIQSVSSLLYLGPSGTSDNVLLRKNGSGTLAILLGDDSAYGNLECAILNATAFALSPLYLINGSAASDVRLRKETTSTLGIVTGDASAYADVYLKNLVVTGARLHLGPLTTSGALFRLNSGTPELREGDDSGYNDLILRDLGAVNITATGTVTAGAFSGPFAGAVSLPDGSAGSPALKFTNDTDTGFFLAGSGAIGVAGNAAQIATFAVFDGGGSGSGDTFYVSSRAFGTGAIGGSVIGAGANSSGSGAASCVRLQRRGGTYDFLWSETAGLLRMHTGQPNEADAFTFTDTSGTVVGDQTSQRAVKYDIHERFDYESSLNVVLDAAVYDFRYKDHRYNDELFTGIITDQAPLFGKDNGKALNEVSAIGHLIQAIKAQQQQIERLESELIALRKRVE